jgi:hypothetical protein
MSRGWSLWVDWCTATGRSPLPVTEEGLVAFEHDVRSDHTRDIRRFLTDAGMTWPRESRARDPWEGIHLLSLGESLHQCPTTGWPDGYRGRRDAWLLLLTLGLRLCRAHALAVRVPDIAETVGGVAVTRRALSRADDPAACLVCVTQRWLAVLAAESRWGRAGVREMLAPGRTSRGHVCTRPLPQIPSHQVLAPAIDRHGWSVDWRPMTPRAVTGVLAARCRAKSPAQQADQHAAPESGPTFNETTFKRLDAACRAADEVNARAKALLDDTDGLLTRVGRHGRDPARSQRRVRS